MRSILRYIPSFILIIAFTASCKKYPEGPAISLRSKKARVCGEWRILKLTRNGTDSYFNYDYRINIEKDGHYHIKGSYTDEGNWELSGDDKKIIFTPATAGAEKIECLILKLKNNELWWKQTEANGDVIETHMIP